MRIIEIGLYSLNYWSTYSMPGTKQGEKYRLCPQGAPIPMGAGQVCLFGMRTKAHHMCSGERRKPHKVGRKK